jgi:NADH dehydrogenase FAD-containing subunit
VVRLTTDHELEIAGAGPTGLMLAGELALATCSFLALATWFGSGPGREQ